MVEIPDFPSLLSELRKVLAEKLREELTSGDPATRKLLTELLLSTILKDSTGAELSSYIKNIDIKVSDFKTSVYGYFKQAGVDWNGKSISAGDTTDELSTLGYSQKTFCFLSNVSGVLTIQVKEPDGDWRTYDTQNVTAGVLLPYLMTAQAISVRLSFDQSATVTAWYVMRVV